MLGARSISRLATAFVVVCSTGIAAAVAQSLAPVPVQANDRNAGFPRRLEASEADEAKAAAEAGLRRFEVSVASGNFSKLGFASADELSTDTLGAAMQIVTVPLARLASYSGDQDAATVLSPNGGLIVPVMKAGQVRCAVFLKRTDDGYLAIGLGQPHMTALLTKSINQVATRNNVEPDSLVVVKVLALFQTFIGRSSGIHFYLTPVTDTPAWGLHSGEEMAASVAFKHLVQAARDYQPSH